MSQTPPTPHNAVRPVVRPSRDEDVPAIAAIYAWNVAHGTGTFETEPPNAAEMGRRRAEVLGRGLPWLVVEADLGDGPVVLGYAYANPFRLRLAWRYALEDSIYLAPQAQRRGLGRLLLAELVGCCTALGARQMFAVIGDSANAGSIGVHRACGFVPVGTMRSCGWKFERWLDVVILQRDLGPGDRCVPDVAHPGVAP